MTELCIEKIHEALKNNEITCDELINEALMKAHKLQDKCNAFVTIIDDATGNVNDNLLSGIPYGIKDNYSTKGILSTGSSNTLKDYVPFFDATAVSNLKKVGAVGVGKTALDEFGMGGTGTTAHTGIIKNPWDTKRICGGSSAGSACSVAAGVYPYSLGSDTGDSIRKPAAYCGIVGYKPTYGMISRYGLFPYASSLDTCGVLTRNVRDAAIVVDAMKGIDENDLTSWDSSDIHLYQGLNKDITLILNSDDPFSSMLGEKNKNKCVYFGIDKLDTDKKISNNLINDFLVCPKCSSNLKYDYIRYHQIGQVHCPNCSFENKKADFLGNLDYKNNRINVTNKNNNYKFKMINDSIFNCYNEMALITTLFTLNIDEYKIKSIIEKLELPKIRYMSNYANGVEVINFVSKGLNAVATSRVCDYLSGLNDNLEIVLILDDQFDSKNNSETMTWIYDTDFELLNKPNIKKIIVGGVRNRDYKHRLLLAGIDKEKIFTCDKEDDVVDFVTTEGISKIYILLDILLVSKAAKINERIVEKIKKENL